jgi:hypothetical protein
MAKRDRPSNQDPPYPWKDYIVYLEGKVHRLETERDKLVAVQQQPGLFDTLSAEPEAPTSALFGDDPTANALGGFRGSDPSTSREAALGNYPKSGSQRHEILLALFKAGSHGLTFDEAREQLDIYSTDRRLDELVKGGWAERTERTRATSRGAEAIVYTISAKGSDWIKNREPHLFLEVTRSR